MKKADIEIDFLGMAEMSASSTLGHGTSSSRGVHKYSLPKLNTRLGRTGIASASPHDPLPSAEQSRRFLSPTPVGSPASRSAAGSSPSAAAPPLTIFYNGVVATFNLPRDKAEAIIECAERSTSRARQIERPTTTFNGGGGGGGGQQQQPPPASSPGELGGVCWDLPLARKRSLQRFLEKRKER